MIPARPTVMVKRLAAPVVLLLSLLAAGCANGGTDAGATPAPVPSASDVVDLPLPSAKPGVSAGGNTISGTVSAGIEPSCLLLQDASGSHLLIFDEPSLRAQAKVGDKVTLVGRSDPSMMSTCQQGTPFVVSAVRPS